MLFQKSKYAVVINFMGAQGRSGTIILESGGTNITASKASRKILGVVPPHMTFCGTTVSDSVTQEYACYNNLTGHAFIGL